MLPNNFFLIYIHIFSFFTKAIMTPKTAAPVFLNPYYQRPWLQQNGAAAPAGGGNKGVKGIIAGFTPLPTFLYLLYRVKFQGE